MCLLFIYSCGQSASDHKANGNSAKTVEKVADKDSATYCSPTSKSSLIAGIPDNLSSIPAGKVSHEGMVRIPGGEFMMGATDEEGRPDEYPAHKVKVNGFWMDKHEVTNAGFRQGNRF